jgi:hypothetical protein
MQVIQVLLISIFAMYSCKKTNNTPKPIEPEKQEVFSYKTVTINDKELFSLAGVNEFPIIKITFTAPINPVLANKFVKYFDANNQEIASNISFENKDSTLIIKPEKSLIFLNKYNIEILPELVSKKNTQLKTTIQLKLNTGFDESQKYPNISEEELLTKVQEQTFKYFWDFGHPISGLSRERNTSGDIVTSGGSGFGIMAIVIAINRGFITRESGFERMIKITNFLKNKAVSYHGAFPHWLNGSTGATVAFSQKDNGADLVETSYLMQGLLAARQYFTKENEQDLIKNINQLYSAVEWTWFQKNKENVLYWHWSPNYNWDMNMKISGYNEALITYVLAASSPTFPINKEVYDAGWARNGGIKNGKTFYDTKLPLGFDYGGPLFFSQYSFLGIDPHGLSDNYADYWQQNVSHSQINYKYCISNPKKYFGYSQNCWGLTASDTKNGYSAHDPNNDLGVISPTAALSSMPYTPKESKQALNFFYYKIGDKVWKNYGFIDAFDLNSLWFANSFLAIDQGPIIIMIENHRTGLIWDLFMSSPEVKTGLKNLGFKSPKI